MKVAIILDIDDSECSEHDVFSLLNNLLDAGTIQDSVTEWADDMGVTLEIVNADLQPCESGRCAESKS